MPCPFPGMDPFIESENWQDFHLVLTAEIKRQLAPQLPRHYRISAELVVKADETREDDTQKTFRPDIGIIQSGSGGIISQDDGDTTILTPPTRKAPAPVAQQRELRIYDARNRRLVTAIEVLSPANKQGSGLVKHMEKLQSYWRSDVNTIDIDLLRGGIPPYSIEIVPLNQDHTTPSPYRIVQVRPNIKTLLWEIGLVDTLPTIPVPLSYPDQPVVLNVQQAFTEFYAYSTYPARTDDELKQLQLPLDKDDMAVLGGYL
ncbi:MAG: DUF4058 family protein [Bacteroidota bacterium]